MQHLTIVVICLDTFRADIVGPNKRLSGIGTPALDALTAESARFSRTRWVNGAGALKRCSVHPFRNLTPKIASAPPLPA